MRPATVLCSIICAAGCALNAAVALENQLLSMFGPLLSMATIIRFDPYYPRVNASFDRIAAQLLDQVGLLLHATLCMQAKLSGRVTLQLAGKQHLAGGPVHTVVQLKKRINPALLGLVVIMTAQTDAQLRICVTVCSAGCFSACCCSCQPRVQSRR
jgi:hypothetical protein